MSSDRGGERPRRSYGRKGGSYGRGRSTFGRGSGDRREGGGYGRGGGGYGGRRGGGEGYGRSGRDSERDRGPAPVEVDQEVDVKIESVGRRGDGIARINNFVIFIPNTNEGEQVKVKITGVRNSFATGEVVGRGGETPSEPSSEASSEETTGESYEEESDENR